MVFPIMGVPSIHDGILLKDYSRIEGEKPPVKPASEVTYRAVPRTASFSGNQIAARNSKLNKLDLLEKELSLFIMESSVSGS